MVTDNSACTLSPSSNGFDLHGQTPPPESGTARTSPSSSDSLAIPPDLDRPGSGGNLTGGSSPIGWGTQRRPNRWFVQLGFAEHRRAKRGWRDGRWQMVSFQPPWLRPFIFHTADRRSMFKMVLVRKIMRRSPEPPRSASTDGSYSRFLSWCEPADDREGPIRFSPAVAAPSLLSRSHALQNYCSINPGEHRQSSPRS
jgi:hypothetical protein